MTTLAEFQRRTVAVALEHLEATGPRRFLVADEVGLGKTVIARAVAEGLRENRRRLNVMYLCPSLEIVGQNRLKFISPYRHRRGGRTSRARTDLALVPGGCRRGKGLSDFYVHARDEPARLEARSEDGAKGGTGADSEAARSLRCDPARCAAHGPSACGRGPQAARRTRPRPRGIHLCRHRAGAPRCFPMPQRQLENVVVESAREEAR